MKNPNIIFLDIDGVLCTMRSHIGFGDKGGLMEAWDVTCCQMIRKICVCGKFKIVISSTWRNSSKIKYWLCMYGLVDHMYNSKDETAWKTPNTERKDENGRRLRGYEIDEWMQANYTPDLYFIIDDDTDFLEEQKPFHIKTDSEEGFGYNNFSKIDDIFKEKYGEHLWKRIQEMD